MKYLLILIASIAVFSVYAEPLPPVYFAKNAAYESVKISPDGQHIAVVVPSNDRSILTILKTSNLEAVSLFQSDANQYVGRFDWVTDKKIVFGHSKKLEGDEQKYNTGHIFSANIDGSKETVIFGYMMQKATIGTRLNNKSATINAIGRVVHKLPNNEKNILVAASNYGSSSDDGEDLYKVNFQNGKRWQVTRTPAGRMRYVFNESGEIIFAAGSNVAGEFEGHLYKDGEWKQLRSFREYNSLSPVGVSNDGEILLLSAALNGETEALYEYQVSSQKLTLKHQDSVSDIYSYIVEPNSKRVVGVKNMPGLITNYYLDEKDEFALHHKGLTGAFKGSNVTILSATADGKWYVVEVDNDRNPGDFYLYNAEKKDVAYLMSRKEWLDPEKMAKREPFTFKSKNGHELHGYITWPNQIEKPASLVTLVHGGPFGAQDDWFYESEAQMLANNGYAVLQVNYRGSGGYGAKHELSAYKKVESVIQQDIIEATQWALQKEKIDSKKVCIMGSSFGGASAIFAPSISPDLFKCSISIAGVYDMVKHYDDRSLNLSKSSNVWRDRLYGRDEVDLKRQSAITYIDKFNIPILVVHGGKDWVVDEEQSFILKDALEQRKIPFEWYFKDEEGHGFHGEKNREQLYAKIIEFLGKYL